jgi:ABC-type Fe3+ transport system permease subunit
MGADRALTALALAGLGVPLLFFAVRNLISAEASSINLVFLLTLARALVFSSLQAAASSLVACALALVVSVWVVSQSPRRSNFFLRSFGSLGAFVFALPGTALALATLDLFRRLPGFPATGGPLAIVWAHVTWNLGLLSIVFSRRLRSFFGSIDAEGLEAAVLFGARGWHLFANSLWPVLKPEVLAWSRLVFYWSFGAFSTLLILGDGPRHANPEVLLFYSLLNDNDGARLLVLALVQGLVAWRITKLAPPPAWHEESQREAGAPPAAQAIYSSGLARSASAFVAILLLTAVAWVLIGPPLGLIACVAEPRCLDSLADVPWLSAVAHSFLLSLMTALLSAAAMAAFILANARARRLWSYFFCVSPALLGAAWIQLPAEELLRSSPWAQLLVASLALTFSQMPFLSFWARSRLAVLREDVFESAMVLGAPRARLGTLIKLPLCRDLVARAALLGGCIALGELALTSIFVRDADLVASQARLLASRYDFAGGALALTLTCVLAGVLMLIVSPWMKKRLPA